MKKLMVALQSTHRARKGFQENENISKYTYIMLRSLYFAFGSWLRHNELYVGFLKSHNLA